MFNVGDLLLFKNETRIIINVKDIGYKTNNDFGGDVIEYVILQSNSQPIGRRSFIWSSIIENELAWGWKIIKYYEP